MQETVTQADLEEAARLGKIVGLKEAAEIVRKYPPLDWLANEIMEGIDA
jgi:hypothetical protein